MTGLREGSLSLSREREREKSDERWRLMKKERVYIFFYLGKERIKYYKKFYIWSNSGLYI